MWRDYHLQALWVMFVYLVFRDEKDWLAKFSEIEGANECIGLARILLEDVGKACQLSRARRLALRLAIVKENAITWILLTIPMWLALHFILRLEPSNEERLVFSPR